MTETESKLWDAASQIRLALEPDAADETVRSSVVAFIGNARTAARAMQEESGATVDLSHWYERQMGLVKDAPLVKLFNEEGVEARLPADRGDLFRACEQYFLFLRWFVTEWLKARIRLGLTVGDSRLMPASARVATLAGGYVWGYY
jgi:hypothetical protein